MEESKDGATTLVPSPHSTPVPSPHTTPIPSPHATPIPSPHHSPIPSVSASLLKPSGSPIQIVDLGDGKSGNSESTESTKAEKKNQEVDKGQSSSKLISQDPTNTFSSIVMMVTLVKKKMFSI